jgi:hypothetical protein
MAGYPAQVSAVLKPVLGLQIATAQKYTPSEIIGLSNANVIPVIDPALIPGDGLFLAEGRTFTSDADLLDLDTVRVLDAADFALKAGLIGTIGDARITKAGLMSVQLRTEAILGTMAQADMVAGYTVRIPVLDILSLPESSWSPAEADSVSTARQTRSVAMDVALELSGVVHHLLVTLNPVFA